MSNIVTSTGEVPEGNDWFLTYRLVRADGVLVSDASVTATSADALWVNAYGLDTQVAVQDKSLYTAVVTGSAAKASNIVIDTAAATLKTDGFWGGVDSTGYNFFYKVPYATWMAPGRYRIEFALDITQASTAGPSGGLTLGKMRWASHITVKAMVGA
tara:strand:- start:212 stop:682 length:471 start_codon:yes stop_codon:yes gene_type:complete